MTLALPRELVVTLVLAFLVLGVVGVAGLALWVRQELRVVLAHRRYKHNLSGRVAPPYRIRSRI